jgi:hypothetical protein
VATTPPAQAVGADELVDEQVPLGGATGRASGVAVLVGLGQL